MTAAQLPLSLAQPHRNQQLFSDHYLNTVLPERADWKALADEAGAVQQQIRAILEQFVPSHNEAQTEDGLVKPVLTLLGHTYEVQAALKTPHGTKKPDYVFYTDSAARALNKDRTLDAPLLAGKAFAVGDAKYWDRPLDVSLKIKAADPDINKVPSDQIAYYMLHSGATWGILTNGRLWRLYHTDTAQRQDRYYEVDLEALARHGSPQDFCYFYAFFRRHAFDDHDLSAAAILQASIRSARAISEDLRQQVYHALLALAQGFLDYPANGLSPDPQTLRQIYDSSLIVLYRILFVLYAEARELLPYRANALYRNDYSLSALAELVARRRDAGHVLLPTTSQLWARLRDLFDIVNVGSTQLGVATFNGGLFDPQRHAFLARYTVGDARLAEAIDRLTRINREFIDYRDLAERHLGTIYEGLLEQHLAPMAPKDSWTVELLDSAGERHRTGSYYTPDFVVQYIVAQTVGPALERVTAGKQTDEAKLQAVLELNVCDPAMGSGHFLVAAMEYIARYLVELGISPGEAAGGEADLAFWKRRVAQSCIYGVDLNPLAVELAKLSLWLVTAAKDRPLSFLDHHLRCGNAVVGTRLDALDLQPQATRPARARKARKEAEELVAAGQVSMLDDDEFRRSMSSAVDSLWLIEENPALTIADVKQQEQLYILLRNALSQRYLRLGDLVAARRLGLQMPDELWGSLTDYVTGRSMAAVAKVVDLAEQARSLVEQHRPFHWELEFPEVFFDKHGQPLGDLAGFDAVVGNPPYVRQELLAPIKPYLQAAYPAVYHGTADLYVYFVAQGARLLQQGGLMSYISSNSWLRANYAGPLRAFLRQQVSVEQIVDLGDNRVFAEAPDVYPAILLLRASLPSEEHSAQAAVFSRGEGVKQFGQQVAAKLSPITIHDQADTGWQLGADAGRRVFHKMASCGLSLEKFLPGPIYFGVKTGYNEGFIIDTNTRNEIIALSPSSEVFLKSMMRGQDLRPWYVEDNDQWLIVVPCGWSKQMWGEGEEESYYWSKFREYAPALANHLIQYENKARKRSDMGDYWWELRPCNYYDVFDGAKILWPDIAKQPRFVFDVEKRYAEATTFFTGTSSYYLYGILQSRATWFSISNLCHHLGERAGIMRYRLKTQYLIHIPIPDAPLTERETIGALAMQITEQAKARYALHQRARRRVQSDLGGPEAKLSQKLTAWWELDFPAFRAEVQKVFKRDIALKERDDWEEWLEEQRRRHRQHTETIVRLETELNARVYALFDLSADEIKLIEESTKYKYGEV